MSRGGGLLAAVLGAGGASAYYTGDALGPLRSIPGLGNLGSGGFGQQSSSWQAGSGREVDDLKRLVEQLSRDLGRQNQGFTIVTAPGTRGGTSAYAVVALVTAGGVIYLRLFRGWRLADLMYVTRNSLHKSLSQVSAGMDNVKVALQQQVDLVRSKLGGQLEAFKAESKEAQDAMAEAQDAMAEHLRTVGSDVEGTREDIATMQANLDDIGHHQQTANEGIRLLCSVVGDLMAKTGYRMASVVELDKYVKRPRMSGSPRVQGLEGLLSIPEVGNGQAPGRTSSDHSRRGVLNASEPASLLRAASMRRSPELDRTQSEPPPA